MTAQDTRVGADDHARLSQFLQRMRSEQRMGFLALRAVALSLGADVVERVEGTEATYLRRARPFATLRAGRGSPSLVFPREISLPDPMGRLLRRGDEHYVNLQSAEDLDGHVQEFVRRAYSAVR